MMIAELLQPYPLLYFVITCAGTGGYESPRSFFIFLNLVFSRCSPPCAPKKSIAQASSTNVHIMSGRWALVIFMPGLPFPA